MLRVEEKKNNKWVTIYELTEEKDMVDVYKRLADALISKKVNKCTFIKSIKRVPLYNGTHKIIISYDNNVRDIYIIPDR